MPVILPPEDEEDWLSTELTEPAEMVRLLRPYPANLLEARPREAWPREASELAALSIRYEPT